MNKDIKIAKQTINTEIQALKKLSASFNRSSQFSKAVNLISKIKGKCLVIGVGKSYLCGLKTASTLSSLGTPSIAFSANDLQHGGLGAIQKNRDILLVFSVSGESSELNSILQYAKRNDVPVVGVSCKSSSMLLRYSTIKILLPKVVEAGKTLTCNIISQKIFNEFYLFKSDKILNDKHKINVLDVKKELDKDFKNKYLINTYLDKDKLIHYY